jgi:hypothetical protein
MKQKFITCVVLASAAFLGAARANASGILLVATDTEEFNGLPTDRIARVTTVGAIAGLDTIINTDYPVNGLADSGTFLFAGDPFSETLRYITYGGVLGGSVPVAWNPGNLCCGEDMAFDPTTSPATPNGTLYHPHFANNIQAVDPATGGIFQTFDQPDVVGMAHVGGTIWITHWGGRQVGPWDPLTNTFTPIFSTPTNAGMLAYDPFDSILWVGLQGGAIHPYDLLGNSLGSDFFPFGEIADTIDGGVFQGEATPAVPEPASIGLLGLGLTVLARYRQKRSR